jgi:transcription antitermination factor NusG
MVLGHVGKRVDQPVMECRLPGDQVLFVTISFERQAFGDGLACRQRADLRNTRWRGVAPWSGQGQDARFGLHWDVVLREEEMLQVNPTQIIPPPIAVAPSEFPQKHRGDWYVLHTRSRQEKTVSDMLCAMGIAHFLPLTNQVRYYGTRKFTVELPLFPSYVFLRGSMEEAYDSNRTKRIARVISVNNQTQIDWELHNLFRVMESGASLDPFPYLTTGTRVEVRAGPFRGVQGVIDSRLKSDRLLLQIDMLGRAVSLEVDAALLEVVEQQDRGYAN